MTRVTEIQITPVKPQGGLIAFASFVLDKDIYLSSIGIATKLNGGFRLIYPTKKIGHRDINLFHPINKSIAQMIEEAVLKNFEEVMNQSNDRYYSLDVE